MSKSVFGAASDAAARHQMGLGDDHEIVFISKRPLVWPEGRPLGDAIREQATPEGDIVPDPMALDEIVQDAESLLTDIALPDGWCVVGMAPRDSQATPVYAMVYFEDMEPSQ